MLIQIKPKYKTIPLALSRVPVLVLPPVPQDMSDDLINWFDKSQTVFTSLKEIMFSSFIERMHRLHDMPKKACNILWWPFTQHKFVPQENVTVIDSRCGENLAVHKVSSLECFSSNLSHSLILLIFSSINIAPSI